MGINLVISRDKCCGCGACEAACPKNAIKLVEDEYGFIFPQIDKNECIECGACEKCCQYHQVVEMNQIDRVYAAAIRDERIHNSSSGGIFIELAHAFIKDKGIVVGAAMICEEGKVFPKHIVVKKETDLVLLQGSKYAQSKLEGIFESVRAELLNGTKVLFSGTPCQVASIKAFLKKDYSNFYTIDVICHGVPNVKMFNDYLELYSHKLKGEIIDYKFRDKELGWGINMRAYTRKSNNQIVEKIIPPEMSSFFSLFLRSDIIRDSCIECCYATNKRIGDITLGDYWGINTAHPEAFKHNIFDYDKGVSSVFVNSEKGHVLFDMISSNVAKVCSEYAKVVRFNSQAEKPVQAKKTRKKALDIYREYGYVALEQYYWEIVGRKKYYYIVKNLIPRKIRVKVKKILGK